MKMKRTLIFLSLMLFAVAGQAEKKKKPLIEELSGQGYGMAGCGLGSVFFGDSPNKAKQLGAVFVNGLVFPQTFAISSGISNCGETKESARLESEFIKVNRIALESEAARGGGETTDALTQLMGCRNNSLGLALKKNYLKVFSNNSNDDVRSEIAKLCLMPS